MLSLFWNEYLFRPVFNVLIYFYNTYTSNNLGVAVIYLTVLLRIILLPFSVISIWKQEFYKKLSKDISKLTEAYKNDQVLQNQEIREFLKKHRVNPWSKAVVLGVQALTLVLLYQVFLGGIRGEKLQQIYGWVGTPDFINSIFLGFNLGDHSLLWAAAVGAYLFIEVTIGQRARKEFLVNADVVYRFFFPLLVFFTLYALPMVKSLFILTSLVFSTIVVGGIEMLFNVVSKDPAEVFGDDDEEE